MVGMHDKQSDKAVTLWRYIMILAVGGGIFLLGVLNYSWVGEIKENPRAYTSGILYRESGDHDWPDILHTEKDVITQYFSPTQDGLCELHIRLAYNHTSLLEEYGANFCLVLKSEDGNIILSETIASETVPNWNYYVLQTEGLRKGETYSISLIQTEGAMWESGEYMMSWVPFIYDETITEDLPAENLRCEYNGELQEYNWDVYYVYHAMDYVEVLWVLVFNIALVCASAALFFGVIRKEKTAYGKLAVPRSFWIWITAGASIFIVMTGGFNILAKENVCDIMLEALTEQADRLKFRDGALIMEDGSAQIYFNAEQDMDVNYIDISVQDMEVRSVNAKLYYADKPGEFKETDAAAFYLNRGCNEITLSVRGKKYFRLDILNGKISLDAITLRAALNPRYQILWGLVGFLFVWVMLYFVAVKFGVHFTSVHNTVIVLLEGMFASLMLMIMLYAVGRVRYRLTVYMLTPFLVALLAVLYTKISVEKTRGKVVFCVLLIDMAVLMCLVGSKMLSTPYNDLGTIYYSAWEIATDGKINTVYTGQEVHRWFFESSNNDYFVQYHNNIPLLAIFAVYYKVLSLFGLNAADSMSNYMSVLLNVVFIMMAVVLGALTAKNLFGKKGMLVYLVASMFSAPYYINACRFYTDTISMPFISAVLWMYTSPDKRFRSPYIKYGMIGILLAIGALIKGSILVLLIAILLHLVITNVGNIRFALLTGIVVVGMSSAWGVYIQNCSWIDMSDNDALEFPLTHYFMMGLNRDTNGGYSQEDFEYTDQYASKAEKQKANIEKIKQRIVGFGTLGDLGEYELSRAANTWFDGQYMQDDHIIWGINKGRLYDGLIAGRKYNKLFKIYVQIFTFCMHIFAVAGGLLRIRNPKNDHAMFLRLTMLGAMCFFMIWESKSRYILNFTPVFLLAAIYGAQAVQELFFDRENHSLVPSSVIRSTSLHS